MLDIVHAMGNKHVFVTYNENKDLETKRRGTCCCEERRGSDFCSRGDKG